MADRVRNLMTDAEIATLDALSETSLAADRVATEAAKVKAATAEAMGVLIRGVYARQPKG